MKKRDRAVSSKQGTHPIILLFRREGYVVRQNKVSTCYRLLTVLSIEDEINCYFENKSLSFKRELRVSSFELIRKYEEAG